MGDRIYVNVNQVFESIQSFKMADVLGNFWKELKALGRVFIPFLELRFGEKTIKSRVQFNAVELTCIISQFVLRAARVEIFQICFVPFRAPDVKLRRSRAFSAF